jgi:hypothetical protein
LRVLALACILVPAALCSQVLRFRSADDARDGAAVTPDVDEGGVAESALRVANVLLVYRRGTAHLGNARAALRELAAG